MKLACGVAGALLVGVVLGAVSTALCKSQYQKQLEEACTGLIRQTCVSEISEPVDTLIALRRGTIDSLISNKEKELSRGIYHVSMALEGSLLSNTNIARALKGAAKYRSAHPFKTGNVEQDQVVEELLKHAQSTRRNPQH